MFSHFDRYSLALRNRYFRDENVIQQPSFCCLNLGYDKALRRCFLVHFVHRRLNKSSCEISSFGCRENVSLKGFKKGINYVKQKTTHKKFFQHFGKHFIYKTLGCKIPQISNSHKQNSLNSLNDEVLMNCKIIYLKPSEVSLK